MCPVTIRKRLTESDHVVVEDVVRLAKAGALPAGFGGQADRTAAAVELVTVHGYGVSLLTKRVRMSGASARVIIGFTDANPGVRGLTFPAGRGAA